MQNLSADMFSGYMHDYKPLNGGSRNSDYNLQDGGTGRCGRIPTLTSCPRLNDWRILPVKIPCRLCCH